MKLLIILIFICCATKTCTSCDSKSIGSRSLNSVASTSRSRLLNAIPGGTTNPRNLTFSTGDVITCDIHSSWAASHIMLAVSSISVIHAPGISPGGPEDQTRVIEEDLLVAASEYDYCKVITKSYDEEYRSRCRSGPLNTTEIVRRADESRVALRGRTTHYNSFRCNCEHWVSAWRYGTSWTLQTGPIKYKSNQCEAPGKSSCFN